MPAVCRVDVRKEGTTALVTASRAAGPAGTPVPRPVPWSIAAAASRVLRQVDQSRAPLVRGRDSSRWARHRCGRATAPAARSTARRARTVAS